MKPHILNDRAKLMKFNQKGQSALDIIDQYDFYAEGDMVIRAAWTTCVHLREYLLDSNATTKLSESENWEFKSTLYYYLTTYYASLASEGNLSYLMGALEHDKLVEKTMNPRDVSVPGKVRAEAKVLFFGKPAVAVDAIGYFSYNRDWDGYSREKIRKLRRTRLNQTREELTKYLNSQKLFARQYYINKLLFSSDKDKLKIEIYQELLSRFYSKEFRAEDIALSGVLYMLVKDAVSGNIIFSPPLRTYENNYLIGCNKLLILNKNKWSYMSLNKVIEALLLGFLVPQALYETQRHDYFLLNLNKLNYQEFNNYNLHNFYFFKILLTIEAASNYEKLLAILENIHFFAEHVKPDQEFHVLLSFFAFLGNLRLFKKLERLLMHFRNTKKNDNQQQAAGGEEEEEPILEELFYMEDLTFKPSMVIYHSLHSRDFELLNVTKDHLTQVSSHFYFLKSPLAAAAIGQSQEVYDYIYWKTLHLQPGFEHDIFMQQLAFEYKDVAVVNSPQVDENNIDW